MDISWMVTSGLFITQMFDSMKFPKTLCHCQEVATKNPNFQYLFALPVAQVLAISSIY